MSAISISTRDLRVILLEVKGKDMSLSVRAAHDIYGPGGSVFIASNAKITERQLSWLEQRNPAAGQRPTYVDVVISQERGGSRPPESGVSEPISATQERTRKAREVSREVVVKAEDVARKATEIYRIVGGSAFTVSALRNRDVVDNLQELEGRIKHFHTAVRAAIDELPDRQYPDHGSDRPPRPGDPYHPARAQCRRFCHGIGVTGLAEGRPLCGRRRRPGCWRQRGTER